MFIVRVLAFVMAIIVIGALGCIGFKTAYYMVNQGFDFDTASEWAVNDFEELLYGIFPEVEAEPDVIIIPMTNQHIDVVACTSL